MLEFLREGLELGFNCLFFLYVFIIIIIKNRVWGWGVKSYTMCRLVPSRSFRSASVHVVGTETWLGRNLTYLFSQSAIHRIKKKDIKKNHPLAPTRPLPHPQSSSNTPRHDQKQHNRASRGHGKLPDGAQHLGQVRIRLCIFLDGGRAHDEVAADGQERTGSFVVARGELEAGAGGGSRV